MLHLLKICGNSRMVAPISSLKLVKRSKSASTGIHKTRLSYRMERRHFYIKNFKLVFINWVSEYITFKTNFLSKPVYHTTKCRGKIIAWSFPVSLDNIFVLKIFSALIYVIFGVCFQWILLFFSLAIERKGRDAVYQPICFEHYSRVVIVFPNGSASATVKTVTLQSRRKISAATNMPCKSIFLW